MKYEARAAEEGSLRPLAPLGREQGLGPWAGAAQGDRGRVTGAGWPEQGAGLVPPPRAWWQGCAGGRWAREVAGGKAGCGRYPGQCCVPARGTGRPLSF